MPGSVLITALFFSYICFRLLFDRNKIFFFLTSLAPFTFQPIHRKVGFWVGNSNKFSAGFSTQDSTPPETLKSSISRNLLHNNFCNNISHFSSVKASTFLIFLVDLALDVIRSNCFFVDSQKYAFQVQRIYCLGQEEQTGCTYTSFVKKLGRDILLHYLGLRWYKCPTLQIRCYKMRKWWPVLYLVSTNLFCSFYHCFQHFKFFSRVSPIALFNYYPFVRSSFMFAALIAQFLLDKRQVKVCQAASSIL